MGEGLAGMLGSLGTGVKDMFGGLGDMFGVGGGAQNNLTDFMSANKVGSEGFMEGVQANYLKDQIGLAGQTGWDDIIKNMSGAMSMYNGFKGNQNENKKFSKEMTLYDQQIANNQYGMDKTKKDDISLARAFAPTV